MKTITTLLCCVTLCTASAQQLDWAHPFGSTSDFIYFKDVTTDPALNVIVAGSFPGTMDFDPGPGTANLVSSASRSVFLAKYDADGNYLWAFRLNISMGYTEMTTVECDAAGNIIMSGPLYGTVDFDPGPGSSTLTAIGFGSGDIFIAMYDPSGNFIRCTSIGGPGSEELNDLKLDASGNIYMTGSTMGTFMIAGAGDTIVNSSFPGYDMFMIKMDTNLVCAWAQSMEGSSYTEGLSLAVYSNGDIAVAGIYSGTTIDADPGPGTNLLPGTSYTAGFLARYDTNGGHMWAFGINPAGPASGSVYFQSVAINAAGSCYVAGQLYSSADFNPGSDSTILQTAPGNLNMFVAAYDNSGAFVKAFTAGEGDGRWIALDPAGNVFVTGQFISPVDFDPGPGIAAPVSQGPYDMFVAHYNDTLGYLNSFAVGNNSSNTTGTRGACDANGNYVTIGFFDGTNVDFAPGPAVAPLSAGAYDHCYFAKYFFGPASTEQHTYETGVSVFPNPAHSSVTIALNDSFSNTNGQLIIYDAFGKVVHSESLAGRHRIFLETETWSPGMYLVNVVCEDAQRTLRLVIE